ncbi:MAG: hypothetical protein KAT05_01480 [Spirochaetes bacterium]|nr:hypothetical protein [Spirochaetota bacterium]
MNKKYLLIILSLMLIILPCSLYSKIKAFEFSIGCGFDYLLYTRFMNRNHKYIDADLICKENIVSQGFIFFIPMSFIFYPTNKFGIGTKIQTGLNLYYPNYYYNTYDKINGAALGYGLNNEILLINKFGNYNNSKISLLFEYGISSLLSLFGTYNYYGTSHIGGFLEFYLGPKIFIGFDKIINKGFGIVFGGFIDSNFKIYPLSINYTRSFLDILFNRYPTDSKVITDYYNFSLSIGVEIRLKLSIIKGYM